MIKEDKGLDRIAALEALVRKLASVFETIAHQTEPCQPDGVTKSSALRVCGIVYGNAVAALSHPLVSELTGEKEVWE